MLTALEVCIDGVDNDGDGKIDCADADCAGSPSCAVELCDNDKDDDQDGLIDCTDPECSTAVNCAKVVINGPEICNNKIDDDKDGAIDCRDRDCRKNPLCRIPKYDWEHIKETSRVTTDTDSSPNWWSDRYSTRDSDRYSSRGSDRFSPRDSERDDD